MARTLSASLELYTRAPAFDLPAANPECDRAGGDRRSIDDYSEARVLVVIFMCNHCPFVVHVRSQLAELALDYAPRGVQVVGISSNDVSRYPDDSFDRMREDALKYGYPFPYLYDETQEVARSYGAVCTPDIFVFDPDRLLVYHGRLDDTRPGGEKSHGRELRAALDQLLESGRVTVDQIPSIGCSIKWKANHN